MNNNRRTTPMRIFTALPLFAVSVGLIIAAIILYLQVQNQTKALEDRIGTLDVTQEMLGDGQIDAEEIERLLVLQADIESSIDRALDVLGLYEALGIAVTVGGVLIAVSGAFATTLGINNYNDLVEELNTVRDEFTGSQSKIEENQDRSTEILENLRKSRDDIEKRVEANIRATWESAHLALSLLPLAEKQYQSGNVEGALGTYERAIDLDSSNPVPYYYQGYILTQKNQLTNAVAALRKALELDDKFLHAQAALGYALRRLGEQDEVESDIRIGYFSEAEKMLKKALAENERLVDADGESWYGSLAGLHKRRGDTEQAEYFYKQAAKVTPLSSYPAVNLAIIALEIGSSEVNMRFERVEHLAKQKVTAVQENYWAYGDLLLAQLALGMNNVSRQTIETFIEIIPEGVDDVLPRLKNSIELLLTSKSYPDDKRDRATIEQIIARLTEQLEKE